jgi:hypothetical protein
MFFSSSLVAFCSGAWHGNKHGFVRSRMSLRNYDQASPGSGPSESEGACAGRGARRWKTGIRNVFHR